MKNRILSILFVALFACTTSIAYAQSSIQPNLKFGNPTPEEMSITTCPYDSNAKAMVLCNIKDVSYSYLSGNLRIDYSVKKRIKILSQEGTDEANISIPYYEPANNSGAKESLRSIKATAYNMENGKMIKTKMESKLIFDERLDKQHKVTKFTIPQTKVGTVIEYQYTKTSDFYYQIDDWYAQEDIPTLYTQYDIEIPEFFVFSLDQTGGARLKHNTSLSNRAIFAVDDPTTTTQHSFIGTNLPAVKGDKFVWCPSMYAGKVGFELRSINIPGALYKNFTTSWENIDEMLMTDEDFGGRIKRGNPLKDEMKAAQIENISDFKKKVSATYLLLKKKVKWDGTYALYGNSSRNVLKEGKASNADINFLLMNMLKSLNIKTVPLVMRTRSHGMLPLSHPSVESLNTFVVGIYENDSTLYFMDGSAERGYLNVLPPVLLTNAHMVNGEEVNIMQKATSKVSYMAKGTLHEDGKLEGNLATKYYGIASLIKKDDFLETKDSAEYVKDLAKEMGVNINKYALVNIRKYSPEVTEQLEFEKDGEAADVIYFAPILEKPFTDVPFTSETRDLPVEFNCPKAIYYNSMFKIPNGYVLEEVPQPKFMRSPDNQISFRIQTQWQEGLLTTIYSFKINKPLFLPEEYPGLKNFFEDVYKELNNVVVLKKK